MSFLVKNAIGIMAISKVPWENNSKSVWYQKCDFQPFRTLEMTLIVTEEILNSGIFVFSTPKLPKAVGIVPRIKSWIPGKHP